MQSVCLDTKAHTSLFIVGQGIDFSVMFCLLEKF